MKPKKSNEDNSEQSESSQVNEQGNSNEDKLEELPLYSSVQSDTVEENNPFQIVSKLVQDAFDCLRQKISTGSQNYMKQEDIQGCKEKINYIIKLINQLFQHIEYNIGFPISKKYSEEIQQELQWVREIIQEMQQQNNKLMEELASCHRENISFQEEEKTLKQQLNREKYDYNTLVYKHENLNKSYRLLQDEKSKLEQSVKQLNNELNVLKRHLQDNSQSLKNKNNQLEEKIQQIEKERNEIAYERGVLLSKIAEIQRNTENSLIAGSNPPNLQLVQEFKQLKDQDFHPVSNKIFTYLSERNPDLKDKRRQEIANIKATLADKILVQGLAHFTGDGNFSLEDDIPEEKIADVVKAVSNSLSAALKIPSESDKIQSLKNHIENLVKRGIRLTDNTDEATPLSENGIEKDFSKLVTLVSSSVYSALKIDVSGIPELLKNEIDSLVKKSLELIRKIASADPPGVLLVNKPGEPFNPDKHQAMTGCEEAGKVESTVFPAYMVGSRIFEKAVVTTKVEQEKPDNEENTYNDSDIKSQGKAASDRPHEIEKSGENEQGSN